MSLIRKAFFLIQQAGTLLQMPRSHVRNLGTAFDTIASHSYHVATIAYIIAKMEGLCDSDANKAVTMGVFHDLAEARTGDHDFVAKNYNTCDEHRAIHDFTSGVPGSESLQKLMYEYETRDSLVAKCTKDADMLAQTYHTRVLHRQGNKLAKQRLDADKRARIPHLYTQSAKDIALQMYDTELNPNSWWRDEFVTKKYTKKNLVD